MSRPEIHSSRRHEFTASDYPRRLRPDQRFFATMPAHFRTPLRSFFEELRPHCLFDPQQLLDMAVDMAALEIRRRVVYGCDPAPYTWILEQAEADSESLLDYVRWLMMDRDSREAWMENNDRAAFESDLARQRPTAAQLALLGNPAVKPKCALDAMRMIENKIAGIRIPDAAPELSQRAPARRMAPAAPPNTAETGLTKPEIVWSTSPIRRDLLAAELARGAQRMARRGLSTAIIAGLLRTKARESAERYDIPEEEWRAAVDAALETITESNHREGAA